MQAGLWCVLQAAIFRFHAPPPPPYPPIPLHTHTPTHPPHIDEPNLTQLRHPVSKQHIQTILL